MKQINWNNAKWIIVKGYHELELFTFAGDRINRTFAKLINIFGLGNASSNYKSVIIKSIQSDSIVNIETIITFISNIKHKSGNGYDIFLKKLDENTSSLFFSKFGKCLPDNLIRATLAERSYNFNGLINELNNIQIEILAS